MSATSQSNTREESILILDKIMHGRRSLYPKQYTGEKIDDNIILKLLEYANTAPNHKKTEPWRFIVYSGDSLSELIDFQKNYYLSKTDKGDVSEKKLANFELRKERTSHIIAIIMKRDELMRIPEIEEYAAVSCAIENIYLSLAPHGLGGYWSTGKITFGDEVRKFLNLKEDETFVGFFFLGKVDLEIPPSQKGPVESKITWKK